MVTMFSVRVPGGTNSSPCKRAMVLGKAALAPMSRPPPSTPNFPARAGSANMARKPLPPLWLRSSAVPGQMTAGDVSRTASQLPNLLPPPRHTSLPPRPVSSAVPAPKRPRRPAHAALMKAWSRPPRRSISATRAHARTTSVPGLMRQMQVGLTRDLHATWIDHDQPGAVLTGRFDDRHQMEL